MEVPDRDLQVFSNEGYLLRDALSNLLYLFLMEYRESCFPLDSDQQEYRPVNNVTITFIKVFANVSRLSGYTNRRNTKTILH